MEGQRREAWKGERVAGRARKLVKEEEEEQKRGREKKKRNSPMVGVTLSGTSVSPSLPTTLDTPTCTLTCTHVYAPNIAKRSVKGHADVRACQIIICNCRAG